jgi:hypothetical protein
MIQLVLNKNLFRTICLLILATYFFPIKAQFSSGGIPPSLHGVSYPYTTINLTPLDNEQEIIRADSITASCENCDNENVYFGSGIEIELDILNSVEYVELEDDYLLYKVNLVSTTALGMQFYFNSFCLPEGAELYIYNADSTMSLGAYTYLNNPTDQNSLVQFATQPIAGNSIFIELLLPTSSEILIDPCLSISEVIHIFRDDIPILTTKEDDYTVGSSLPCNINVACSLGNGWANEIKSVALIIWI